MSDAGNDVHLQLNSLCDELVVGSGQPFAMIRSNDQQFTFAIVCEAHVHIFELCPALDTVTDNVAMMRCTLPPIVARPQRQLNNAYLNCKDINQLLILQNAFTNYDSAIEPTQVAWSPASNDKCCIVVVYNNGDFALYAPTHDKYELIHTFSHMQYFRVLSQQSVDTPDAALSTHQAINTQSVTWISSRYLVSSQKNAQLLFWYLNGLSVEPIVKYIFYPQLVADYMHFVNVDNSNGILLLCTAKGVVKKLEITYSDNSITANDTHEFVIAYEDKCKVKKILQLTLNAQTVVIVVKTNCLLATFLANNHTREQYIAQLPIKNITDVQHMHDKLMVTTYKGDTYVVTPRIDDDAQIVLHRERAQVDVAFDDCANCGIIFSPSLCLAFLLRKRCRAFEPTEVQFIRRESIRITALTNNWYNASNLLRNNTTGVLTHLWDCLEVIRIQLCYQKVPFVNYPWLMPFTRNDNVSLYFCRVAYILHKFVMNHPSQHLLDLQPSGVDKLRHMIIGENYVKQLDKLVDKCKNASLSDFDMKCVYWLKRFLQVNCKSNDVCFENEARAIMKKAQKLNVNQMTCESCNGQILANNDCENECLHSHCMYTFVPIFNNAKLCCATCLQQAHPQCEQQLCLFCDRKLVTYHI